MEFFCCSPTCRPTNRLKCQIFKVSAHPDRRIYLCNIIIWTAKINIKCNKHFFLEIFAVKMPDLSHFWPARHFTIPSHICAFLLLNYPLGAHRLSTRIQYLCVFQTFLYIISILHSCISICLYQLSNFTTLIFYELSLLQPWHYTIYIRCLWIFLSLLAFI